MPSIQSLAKLFFFELSHRTGNPIYNLLPDILSRLSTDPSLPAEHFRSIMRHLIKLILEPDGKAEGDAATWSTKLVEKLLARMPDAVAAGSKAARDVGFCLGQLNVNEKGLKRLEDGWKLFEAALAEDEVYESLAQAVARGRKAAKVDTVKAQFEAFEARLAAAHEERSETAAADARATSHEGRAPTTRGEAGEEDGGEADGGEQEGGAAAAPKAKENAAPAAKGRGKAAKKPAATKAAAKKPAARKKKVRPCAPRWHSS